MSLAQTLSGPRTQSPGEDLSSRIAAATSVAAEFADAVDREARFPREAFEALKRQGLLEILLPKEYGGEDLGVSEAAEVCYALGQACSSASMIYAMHSANVACLVNHADPNPRYASYLHRIGREQMLLASSTTEGQNGANIRSSESAIVRKGGSISLARDASVISYGADADAIVTTARRTQDSLPSDQVLALFFRGDYDLRRTVKWDVMGMRGTCSEGFQLSAKGEAEQVLGDSYEKIHRTTMTPVTHLLWASCWAGVAAGAVRRAQLFVRKATRSQKGNPPPGAPIATQGSLSLLKLVNLVDSAIADYLRRRSEPEALDEIAFQNDLNLLKVAASETAILATMQALNACGISGYRNDSEFSIARPLRDIMSASVMINNSRILSNVANSCLIGGVPGRLSKFR